MNHIEALEKSLAYSEERAAWWRQQAAKADDSATAAVSIEVAETLERGAREFRERLASLRSPDETEA